MFSLHSNWDTSRSCEMEMQILRVSPGFNIVVFGVSSGLSFRVFVKHSSLQLLPVPGHLVCKRYEIFSLRVTQNDVGKMERRQNGDKEAECEIKCRAVNVMYRHRHQSHSVIFIPLSSKRVNSMLCVRFCFSVTRCTKIHTVRRRRRRRKKRWRRRSQQND